MRTLLSLLIALPATIYAQETVVTGSALKALPTGTISGTVHDSAGQPIRRALLLAKGDSTGTENRVISDSTGAYIIDGLAIGKSYTLAVVRKGYEPEIWNDIMVADTAVMKIDFKLDRNYSQDVSSSDPIPGMNIVTRKNGELLTRKYIGLDEISSTKADNMLKLIEQIRPGFLESKMDACTPKDTVMLFVDGNRKFGGTAVVAVEAKQTVVTTSSPLGGVVSTSGPIVLTSKQIQERGIQLPAGSGSLQVPPEVLAELRRLNGKNPKEAVKKSLATIPKAGVFDVRYFGCNDWDPAVGQKNTIWITTVEYQQNKELERARQKLQ